MTDPEGPEEDIHMPLAMADEARPAPAAAEDPAPAAPPARPFGPENAALAALGTIKPVRRVRPLHALADRIWLNYAEEADVVATVQPGAGGTGFILQLEERDTSPWFSLFWDIDLATVQGGRYIGLLTTIRSPGFLCYRPCLRLLMPEGEMRDIFPREYVVSSGGEAEQLSMMRIDPALAAQAVGAQMQVFFQNDSFIAEIRSVETVLVA
jgi:hypothetical protein